MISFVYDGDGNRVKRTENSETTVYINCYYEKNVTTGDEYSYYYLGSQQVAMRKNDTPSCIHLDCLSGISVVCDTSGDQVGSTMKYMPFGVCLESQGSLPTDKREIASSLRFSQ